MRAKTEDQINHPESSEHQNGRHPTKTLMYEKLDSTMNRHDPLILVKEADFSPWMTSCTNDLTAKERHPPLMTEQGDRPVQLSTNNRYLHDMEAPVRHYKGKDKCTDGSTYQLLIETTVACDCKIRQTNLYTAWLD